ncbi:MAG: DUF2231 domain-containing protein [Candidatus Manganitrophus sp. SA1]|nr:DUF2231 domain-containing protein [Candidatus Manganitrophus morganii]
METLLPGMAALQKNIHPLLIHFPIAFFLGALAMEGLAVLRDEKFHFAATWMLYLGTLSALVALPTGFIAANIVAATDPRGHDAPGHDYIHIHRNWMVVTTAVGILLTGYLFWINQKKNWASQRWRLLLGLAVLSALVALGADRGGRLVFEFGTGVNPAVLKSAAEESNHGDNH